MKTPRRQLLLPEGVSAGAAIGAGGCHVRAIGMRHSVRCIVNPPHRAIEFLGRADNVENAIADFREIFDQILSTSTEPEKFAPVNAVGESFIHLRAMTKIGDKWKFVRRDKPSLSADAHTKHYDYRLAHAPVTDERLCSYESKHTETPWVFEFNEAFRDRMLTDVTSLCREKPECRIRLKAALGLTCFALRDHSLTSQSLSWTHVQALQQVQQIQPRWSSTWRSAAPPVDHLLRCLLEAAAEQEAAVKTTMTVYVGKKDAKNCEDIVVKYKYEDNQWVPSTSLRPRRVLLAQYDVGVNETQGFRIRAYSVDDATHVPESVSIVEHLDVVRQTPGSHFLTTIETRASMPPHRFVRGVAIKDKIHVEWHGLQFVVSFLNKRRTRVRIECCLLDPDAHDSATTRDEVLAEAMKTLTDKMMVVTDAVACS